MNQTFKRIPVEKTLFFDIEAVRAHKELDPESKEFQMYQKKLRNRDTDELPSIQETQDDYNKRAALKMGYLKIVTIGLGYVRAGEVYVKGNYVNDVLEYYSSLKAAGKKIISSDANSFAAYNSDFVFDVPTKSAKMNIFDEDIPF